MSGHRRFSSRTKYTRYFVNNVYNLYPKTTFKRANLISQFHEFNTQNKHIRYPTEAYYYYVFTVI